MQPPRRPPPLKQKQKARQTHLHWRAASMRDPTNRKKKTMERLSKTIGQERQRVTEGDTPRTGLKGEGHLQGSKRFQQVSIG